MPAGEDLGIFACGSMVHAALEAAETLREKGVSAAVVDLYSIKPLNEELVLDMVSCTGACVTAEEHNVIGGLGSAVAETLFRGGVAAAAEMVGIQDCFTESGPYAALQAKYGLDAGAVVLQPQLFCRECYPCRSGHLNVCENLKVIGVHTDGCACEYRENRA